MSKLMGPIIIGLSLIVLLMIIQIDQAYVDIEQNLTTIEQSLTTSHAVRYYDLNDIVRIRIADPNGASVEISYQPVGLETIDYLTVRENHDGYSIGGFILEEVRQALTAPIGATTVIHHRWSASLISLVTHLEGKFVFTDYSDRSDDILAEISEETARQVVASLDAPPARHEY